MSLEKWSLNFCAGFTEGEVKPRIAVGDEACVTVDKTNAGTGKLKCRATLVPATAGAGAPVLRDLPVEVEDNGDGTVTAYFTPTEAGRIETELRFGGQLIPNGKFSQQVIHRTGLAIFVS